MTSFAGRVEARMTVPAGGAAVAATLPNGMGSATTVTVPAGTYYPSDLALTLRTQLNENLQWYPRNASATSNALGGYGNFGGGAGAGYLCNEASGNLAAVFGSPSLTAAGTPVYGTLGPRGGIDKAIGFNDNADQFTGGTGTFDVSGTSDLAVVWVGKFTATPAGNEFMFVKGNAGTPARWHIFTDATTMHVQCISASGTKESTVPISTLIGNWYVGVAVVDRGAGNVRIAVRTLAGVETIGSSVALFAGETLSNADSFTFGNRAAANACVSQLFAAFYVTAGASVAVNTSANLSAILTSLATTINSGWTASPDTTTGRVTVGYQTTGLYQQVPSFSLDWTNTTLRDALGFTYDLNYADSASEMAAQVGYGAWTAGYHCNESSGNLASAFGTPATLTAFGVPGYGSPGPRGGVDTSIRFASTTTGFSGGSSFALPITDGFELALVMYRTSSIASTNSILASKGSGTAGNGGYWALLENTSDQLNARFQDTNGVQVNCTIATPADKWFVLLMALDRVTGKMNLGLRTLDGATTTIAGEQTVAAVSFATANTFFIGNNLGIVATENVYIAAMYIGSGATSGVGIPANMSTALANWQSTFVSATGANNARGVWLPDCPLNLEGDPKRAPLVSDLRQSVGPTGQVLSLSGNTFKRHKRVVWSHVPLERVWESEATLDYASWEWFFKETQLGLGLSWFSVGSLVQIYDHAGNQVGIDDNGGVGPDGWSIIGVNSIEPAKSIDRWLGRWRIEIPQLIAVGS